MSFPAATTIYNSAFYNCSALTTVSFPEVTLLGIGVFKGCSALTTVSLPALENIETDTFDGSSFTDLTLSSLSVDEVTAGASDWAIPSGCVVHCSDGDYTVP